MAITTKRITMRQGNEADWKPEKMLSAEMAVIKDKKELHFAYADGKTKRVATEDDISELSEQIGSLSLGQHTDGLIYIFVNGQPIGIGFNVGTGGSGGVIEPTIVDDILLSDVDSTFQSEVEALVTTLNATSNNTVNFIMLADTHGSTNGQKSQNVVRYLLKNSKANKCFHLGDMCSNLWSEEEFNTYFAPFEKCIPQLYPVLGNHELFGGNGTSVVYNTLLSEKTNIFGVPESIYYYINDVERKIRYLVINTSDGGTDKVTDSQINWIKTAVQLPSSDWGIIAFSHYPLNPEYGTDSGVQNYSSYYEKINNALITSNGTIISHFCGHVHIDDTSFNDYGYYEQLLLNDGVNGQAVSVASINLDTGNVTIHRIGVGEDISYNYKDIPEDVYYTITNNLTNVVNDNGISYIADGNSYSATLTPNNGHEISNVTVTMGGVDITSTAYSDGIITINEVTGNLIITAVAEPLVLVEEFSADWLIKKTETTRCPEFTFSSAEDVYNNFPDVLSFIVVDKGSSGQFPTGYRGLAYARFSTRTSGWTTHYHNILTYADNPEAFVETHIGDYTYMHFTLTKEMVTAAYESYTNALNEGQIGTGGSILFNGGAKTFPNGNDCWVIAQEVTENVLRRLPSHS